VEVMTVIVVMLILVGLSLSAVHRVVEKAKIISTKALLSQFAVTLECVKSDTGLYPTFLSDLLFTAAPRMQAKGWFGPYLTQMPLDAWGGPFYYKIPPTTLFGSPALPRTFGKPEVATYSVSTVAGKAVLRIENYGVTACSIYLNGVEVIEEWEFRNKPVPQIIEKEVILLDENTVEARLRSTPGQVLYMALSGFVPTKEYFIVGSYGKDGAPGGKGASQDIEWVSNLYPPLR